MAPLFLAKGGGWGMHLTQGTHKWSPEASCCSICHNYCIANPLQSHHQLEWPTGDAAIPSHQKDIWGTSLHDRACMPQHAMTWAANSPVTPVPIRSK